MPEEPVDYATAEQQQPGRRGAGRWLTLLAVWTVGLAVWALYIAAIVYVFFKIFG